MARFTLSERIESPPGHVFELFADLDNIAARIDNISSLEKLTPGPVGVGTRFRETRRIFNKDATEEMIFTAFEPGVSYTVDCESHGTHYRSVYRFSPVDEATQVNVDFEARPVSLGARLLAPLGRLMMSTTRKCLAQDIEALRRVAESKP